MPFTPLHMGAGIALKAITQRHFSLMVFGYSQIIIDIQPLYVMLTGKGALHGFSHTWMGAMLLGLFCGLSGKYLAELGLRILREQKHLPISWRTSLISAYVGTLSHVAIDSIMHSDMVPFYPFSEMSPWYGIISIEALHLWCLGSAMIGGVVYFLVMHYQRQST